MGYPVRILDGTDNLMIPGDSRVYHVGDIVPNLSDETRIHLQANGVRFAAVHADDPKPAPTEEAPSIPPDQAALNDEISAAKKSTKKEA